MANVVAIILARGGSKGIPGKNIIDFCGKPLIVWTIEQLQRAKGVDSIWISSDSEEILAIAQRCNVETIRRPEDISSDVATSESAWLHALEIIERKAGIVDIAIAPQVTSPLREPSDFERGIEAFMAQGCDSLFSCCVIEDLLIWEQGLNGTLKSINYDYKNRKRRQDAPNQYVENGSFYMFKPETLKRYNNRFGVNIGISSMAFWKMFEIDTIDDLKFCEVLMESFLIHGNTNLVSEL